jgi:hypothetical protein
MRPALDPAGHRVPRTKPTCLLHTWRPHRRRPFALVLHLHQHGSSRNLHLQYLAKNQSTQRCQSLITQGSDHPPVLEPHMVLILCGHPHPCCATPCAATTTPTLLSTRGRDAATPATAPCTERRQRLLRARLKAPRSTTTPPPSKSPLFKHRTRHNALTGARFARTVVYSTALYAIPPQVAK